MEKLKKIYFRFYNFNSGDSKHHSLKLFGVSVWAFFYQNRFCWFRIFGYGLKIKDSNIHGLMFSERYGMWKGFSIGKWRISRLS